MPSLLQAKEKTWLLWRVLQNLPRSQLERRESLGKLPLKRQQVLEGKKQERNARKQVPQSRNECVRNMVATLRKQLSPGTRKVELHGGWFFWSRATQVEA